MVTVQSFLFMAPLDLHGLSSCPLWSVQGRMVSTGVCPALLLFQILTIFISLSLFDTCTHEHTCKNFSPKPVTGTRAISVLSY